MDQEAFKRVYNETRNGCNQYFAHPMARAFVYTDGVKELADTGCHWLIDELAFNLPAEFRQRGWDGRMCVIKVTVTEAKAKIVGEFQDGDPSPWSKDIAYTDLPDGEWTLYVSPLDGAKLVCILPAEY